MTRVLHVNRNYMTTALYRLLVDQLEASGVENDVFAPMCKQDVPVTSPRKNDYAPRCFNKIDRFCFDYKQMKIYRALKSRFDVSKYDCVQAYMLFTDGNIAYKIWKKYGVPYVVTVQNTDVNTFFRKAIHLRSRGVEILRRAKAVLFLSKSYKDLVYSQYVPRIFLEELEKKTQVIPYGIDPFWFKCRGVAKTLSDSKELKILLVGLICKNKNVELAQDAVESLRSNGIQASLTVIGRVQDEALLKRIKSRPYTTYLPPVPKEKLIDVYREHDIFVLPSIKESFGLVYAEAMSQGLPVVYSRGQGFDGQFTEGAVGFSVDSSSAKDLADTIEKVLERYSQLSLNCINLVDKFNWSSIGEKYEDIYKSIRKYNNTNKFSV